MALRVKPEIAAEIDSQIWDIYRNRLGGSELRQLAKLFKRTGLLTRLENILSSTLRTPTPHYREDLEIRLAWIDKRPLAKLETNPRRVELGDAAIFFFDVLQNAKTKWYPQSCAVILQAKAAKEKRQIERPSVPVNPTMPRPLSSTARELALLSTWGRFDLYEASGTRDPTVRGISVAPPRFPPANGWYMATPKSRPRGAEIQAWKSPWMCAPAANGSLCNVTLGNLILAFLTSSTVNGTGSFLPEVGTILNSIRHICRCHAAMIGIVCASKFSAFAQETDCHNHYLVRELAELLLHQYSGRSHMLGVKAGLQIGSCGFAISFGHAGWPSCSLPSPGRSSSCTVHIPARGQKFLLRRRLSSWCSYLNSKAGSPALSSTSLIRRRFGRPF
jgi:hypothetical protein